MVRPELLAPAGDLTRLRYALAYGADAVYAGQPAFSLRARENGFRTLAEIAEGIELCHSKGRKFYLASNVIARNAKVPAFCRTLLEVAELGPDALIVADPGIVGFLRKEAPQLEIHLSVQANTTNYLTAEFWRNLGVRRVILSRELSLGEVVEISQRVKGLELEVFVHGNVCMAMSGRCMLSNWASHRDANQGICNNSCRMPYRLYANPEVQGEGYREHEGEFMLERSDGEHAPILLDEDKWGTYFMSSRDLCAIRLLPELMAANLASFKIEGRTRSVYYLSQVVHAYRAAIDSVLETGEVSAEALRAVSLTDSRGRMQGFGKGSELPQNYFATQEKSPFGHVAAQIVNEAPDNLYEVLVKNEVSPSETFGLLSPLCGNVACKVVAAFNGKGEEVLKLHPGTAGRLKIEPPLNTFTGYEFLVRTLS